MIGFDTEHSETVHLAHWRSPLRIPLQEASMNRLTAVLVVGQVTELTESMEKFVIEVISTDERSGELAMKWATAQIKVPFSVADVQ